jgi:4-hydroxybenzoate polyprenyltransferase
MEPGMGNLEYSILIIITILIAAAGYIMNDYFDVLCDRVNKPDKQYIGKQITAGTAISYSVLTSIIAVILSIWLSVNLRTWLPGVLLIFALMVAWWYAIHLKKTFLWGNFAVAGMSAGTIAMAWLIEKQVTFVPQAPATVITKVVAAISIFAFLLSLMREIIKDIEDVEGDRLLHCRSLPIVKGISFAKTILFLLIAITLLLLIIAQNYLLHSSGFIASVWLFIFVEAPLVYFGVMLKKAYGKADYHKLSTLLKWIMLGGIGSIVAGQF